MAEERRCRQMLSVKESQSRNVEDLTEARVLGRLRVNVSTLAASGPRVHFKGRRIPQLLALVPLSCAGTRERLDHLHQQTSDHITHFSQEVRHIYARPLVSECPMTSDAICTLD